MLYSPPRQPAKLTVAAPPAEPASRLHHHHHRQDVQKNAPHPPVRLHKRKSPSLSTLSSAGSEKTRKLLLGAVSERLMMKTLGTRIHSVFDSIKMRASTSSSAPTARHDLNNTTPPPPARSTPSNRRIGLNRTSFYDDSPSPPSMTATPNTTHNTARLQEILPPGMLVVSDRQEDNFSSSAMQLDSKADFRASTPADFSADAENRDPNHPHSNLASTPVRTVRSDRADDGSPTVARSLFKHGHMDSNKSKNINALPAAAAALGAASPLTINLSPAPGSTHLSSTGQPLSLGTLEYDYEHGEDEDDDESRWSYTALDSRMSLDEEYIGGSNAAASLNASGHSLSRGPTPVGLGVHNPKLITFAAPTTTAVLPRSASSDTREIGGNSGTSSRRDTRSTLFDWSEQPLEKKTPAGKSPPRPRTVHGKKDHADRGSRAAGRRAPSGLHMRSQSVPVAPGGQAGKREPVVVTNKFGTWGVGSKGVSEDWDDDFVFDDEEGGPLPVVQAASNSAEEKRVDSGMAMHIPQTIRDQQVKVVNNISLVREFGLLIEELKGIRVRVAEASDPDFPKTELWREIDAMIELADREVDDPFPFRDSPPTPNEFDPFEDISATNMPDNHHNPHNNHIGTPPTQHGPWTPNPRRSRSRRRSVLPYENNDVFSTPTTTATNSLVLASSPANNSHQAVTPPTIMGRPRKDSEAMARSVIEALHRRKDVPSPTAAAAAEVAEGSLALKPVPANQKVLFDTNTLRYIVSHVQALLKKVKVEFPVVTASLPTSAGAENVPLARKEEDGEAASGRGGLYPIGTSWLHDATPDTRTQRTRSHQPMQDAQTQTASLSASASSSSRRDQQQQQQLPVERLFNKVPSWPEAKMTSKRLHFVQDIAPTAKDDDFASVEPLRATVKQTRSGGILRSVQSQPYRQRSGESVASGGVGLTGLGSRSGRMASGENTAQRAQQREQQRELQRGDNSSGGRVASGGSAQAREQQAREQARERQRRRDGVDGIGRSWLA